MSSDTDGKENILIVDDNPTNLRLLFEMLNQHGFVVRTAISGQLALESVRAAPPDLILLDIVMPAMDGYEVCRDNRGTPLRFLVSLIKGDQIHPEGLPRCRLDFWTSLVALGTESHRCQNYTFNMSRGGGGSHALSASLGRKRQRCQA